ncbi:MAG: DNA/RNA nuclease SfsA [Ruminiclostridium sp.]|nr:DNA/RNA nuclease SfsA [Ruminiclostridium sp.]
MKYKNIEKGSFINRKNRFIAVAEINGIKQEVHVKNTGRLGELLISGVTAYFEKSGNPDRKTAYDMVAVENTAEGYPTQIVNIDSNVANDVAYEWILKSGIFSDKAIIRREVKFESSRFDFFIEDKAEKAFLEVKGVTLRKGNVALFPDAPTDRGIKHIKELIKAKRQGYKAYILFVIQMKGVELFTPNKATHEEFAKTLQEAENEGVEIFATDCIVSSDEIVPDKNIKVRT